MTVLSERFTQAVDYARIAHAQQVRKASQIPYLSHLMGVATLVLEHGGSENEAIAGLLHDTLEDCGSAHEQQIRDQFGDEVADIVVHCTESSAERKAEMLASGKNPTLDWLDRKWEYLDHVVLKPANARFVVACDKLHNVRSIVNDMETFIAQGQPADRVFERFTVKKRYTLAYYHSLDRKLWNRSGSLGIALHRAVERMHELAGETLRTDLDDV